MKRILVAAAASFLLLVSCSPKNKAPKAPDVKVSDDKLTLTFERTDSYIYSLDASNLSNAGSSLHKQFGNFIELYCEGILGIGQTNDPDFTQGLHAFLAYPVVQDAFYTSKKVFTPNAIASAEEQLSEAFTRYKGTFPTRQIPKLYTYVAGFNQSVIVADSALGVGLDKYLGSDYKNYENLGFPRYLIRKMTKEAIPSDAMYAWLSSEFPIKSESEPLLSHMVHEGKLIYAVQQLMPNVSDTVLFGFTAEQLKWVNKNERMMWEVLIAQKLLFNSENFVKTKFIGEAPFTNVYTTSSPGKAAVWQGYRIVADYMANTGSSLNDLMKENNYQQILDKAKYRP